MDFLQAFERDRAKINKTLNVYLKKRRRELPVFSNEFVWEQHRLLEQYCLRSGKRLRPILTLAAYKAVGGKKEQDILVPALAFELYHNYTLIHDDIYDEDEQRRGETANHVLLQKWFQDRYPARSNSNTLFKNQAARFGVVAGIINGKYLYTISSLPILESKISDEKKTAGMKLHQLVSVLDNTGQAIDLYFEQEKEVGEQDYYNMVLCKTGQLFKASIEWGAILGEATASQKKALSDFGEEIAIVFQMKDDLLDIDEAGGKGRGIGSDIRKGKKTLLMIHALKKASPAQRSIIFKTLGKEKSSESEIKKIISMLKELGSIEYCQKTAQARLKGALARLERARPAFEPEAKNFLSEFASFMLNRDC